MAKFKKSFDEDDSDLSDSSSSERGSPSAAANKKPPPSGQITADQLEQIGFSAGPSVLTIKEKAFKQIDFDWEEMTRMADGGLEQQYKKAKQAKAEIQLQIDADREKYKQNLLLKRQVEISLIHADVDKKTKDEPKEKKLTFKQREKRKRALDQVNRSTNYVEEEKRILRQHNVFSGFD